MICIFNVVFFVTCNFAIIALHVTNLLAKPVGTRNTDARAVLLRKSEVAEYSSIAFSLTLTTVHGSVGNLCR